jgi:hypothetical protein
MNWNSPKLMCPCCRKRLELHYSESARVLNVKCHNDVCGWDYNFVGGRTIKQEDVDFRHLTEKEKPKDVRGS